VARLDHLSRNVSFIANVRDDMKLSFKVAPMQYADKFQLYIYVALVEQEREFISLRTKAAPKEAKEKHGVKLGGLHDKTMKRNEAAKAQADQNAEELRGNVQPLRAVNATLQTIGTALNNAKIETPRGGQWYPTSVKNLLERLDKGA
jgi:DNA invertase Pin-like site-specific DNA recombinase